MEARKVKVVEDQGLQHSDEKRDVQQGDSRSSECLEFVVLAAMLSPA